MEKTGIIGKGAFGEAIGHLLHETDTRAIFCDKNQDLHPDTVDLKTLIDSADIIFLAVPSWSIHTVLTGAKEFLRKENILVGLSKGINNLGTTSDNIEKLAPDNNYAILSGPMLAEDIINSKQASAIVSSKSDNVAKKVAGIFEGSRLLCKTTSNPKAVSMIGALKNIYVLGSGIGRGLDLGNSWQGAYLTRAVSEMQSLLTTIGLPAQLVHSDAGIGDLLATSISDSSQNIRAGKSLAQHTEPNNSEGLSSLPFIYKMLPENRQGHFPILKTIFEIVRGENPQKIALVVK